MANIKVELLSVEKPNPKVAPSYAHRKAVEEKIKASINTVDDAPLPLHPASGSSPGGSRS